MTPEEVGAGITIWFFGSVGLVAAWWALGAIIRWARRWSGRTTDLERRMQALVHEQREADDEQSRLLVNHFRAQENARQGVYDQDADEWEPQCEPTDYGLDEVWEVRQARQAAEEQSKHLANDEWMRELERWVNATRSWGPRGLS